MDESKNIGVGSHSERLEKLVALISIGFTAVASLAGLGMMAGDLAKIRALECEREQENRIARQRLAVATPKEQFASVHSSESFLICKDTLTGRNVYENPQSLEEFNQRMTQNCNLRLNR